MSKMIQIRNVPDELHTELCRRAKLRRQTLTAYLEGLLEREVARPPANDVFDLIRALPRVRLPEGAAELVHKEREGREAS